LSCSINELKTKEVINISDGARLGFVSDVEIDLADGKVTALVVEGNYRFMGIFGKSADTIIRWEKISKIGSDYIFITSEL